MYNWLNAVIIFGIWWLAMGAIGVIMLWRDPRFLEEYNNNKEEYFRYFLDVISKVSGEPALDVEYRQIYEVMHKYVTPILQVAYGPIELKDAIQLELLISKL